MSIVYDALKKVAERKGEKVPFEPGEPSPPLRIVKDGRRARGVLFFGVLACACLLAGIFLFARSLLREREGPAVARTVPPVAVSSPPESAPPALAPLQGAPPGEGAPPASPPEGEVPRAAARGPFAREEKISLPELTLRGIGRGPHRSWAFINERMVKVGEAVEGAEVLEIGDGKVEMIYNGVRFILRP